MAKVSNLHRTTPRISISTASSTTTTTVDEEFEPQEEFYQRSNDSFLDEYTTSFNLGFDLNENLECEYEEPEPDCFFYGGGEESSEQMNFVADLFECENQVDEGSILEFDDLGFHSGRRETVVIDSDEVDGSEIDHISENGGEEEEEPDWELLENDYLDSMVDRMLEMSVVSSVIEEEEIGEESHEWEGLSMVMNNFRNSRNFGYANSEVSNNYGSEVTRSSLPDPEDLNMDYDTILDQLVENANYLKGSPPAAKSVVENLPSEVLTKEAVGDNDNAAILCVVCKDEIVVGENLTRMPCRHIYHCDCIVPWLMIRNTCPVCRYELPTDDADYERKRSERSVSAFSDEELEARNFSEPLF